ncbi:MAG TPA: protein kinase [Kofleriaceae bacterium]|nr:protein kinase [Kofleriaceae bacterium]
MRPELDNTVAAGSGMAAGSGAAGDPATTATAAPSGSPGESTTAIAPGRQLGHFRIEKQLGAGGMGEVYLATDLALDRPVAIKVLPPHLASDKGRRERMIREARAQAQVVHPNVGHIYFIGEQEGLLYFAMEYVPGKTLAERLAQGSLSVDEALDVIHAAALGLREAQRSGFTHRDVKPSNLMLDGHGVVKVLDFGLAAGEAGVPATGPIAQTSLVGTPLYMAPEQARSEPVDFRADIYALGATLFHLVAGEPPFKADSLDELFTLHATAARPGVRRRGAARTSIAAIDALVARMMAPNPADRFASYDELIRALELASVAHSRPAGFWVRTIATGIDGVLVSIVVGVLTGVIAKVTNYLVDGIGPFFAIGALYSLFATRRWGRTAGKALFELEVVDLATGRRPSWKQSFLRTLAFIGIPAVLAWSIELAHELADLFANDLAVLLALGWFVLCTLALIHAASRVQGKRTPWDRVAGTMVRYRAPRTREPV